MDTIKVSTLMRHSSGDLEYHGVRRCMNCGEHFSQEEDWDGCGCRHCDYDLYEDIPLKKQWETVLNVKRRDDWYEELRDYIAEKGFIRPVHVKKVKRHYELVDGHHRIAAALDLGITHIPYLIVEENAWEEPVADDSGDWCIARETGTPCNHDHFT